jgi:hypothetical protein
LASKGKKRIIGEEGEREKEKCDRGTEQAKVVPVSFEPYARGRGGEKGEGEREGKE